MAGINPHDQHHHDHHNHHHHNHGDEEMSFSERNRAHWNKSAATYNSEHTQRDFGDLINKVNAFILTNINWLGIPFLDPSTTFESKESSPPPSTNQIRVLDYACGPGTITSALSGFATQYIGIDLSEKMVEQYNTRFTNTSTNAHAVTANLLSPSGPPPELSSEQYFSFDLAAIGLGFHHFENLEMCMDRLVARIKPGGVFMIIDFLTHKANDLDHEAVSTVAHNGFSEELIKKLFGDAGLVDVDLVIMKDEVVLRGKAPRTVFMAKGKKSA